MRKLNTGETVVLKGAGFKESKNKEARDAVNALAVGERLLIENQDWHTKTPPAPSTFGTKGQYSVRRLLDETGWVVERLA